MGRMTYAVYGCDCAAGSPAHYSSPYGCTKTFNPQHKAGVQFTYPKGMEGDESSSRVQRPRVEPGPLASEASVTTRPPTLMLNVLSAFQLLLSGTVFLLNLDPLFPFEHSLKYHFLIHPSVV